MIHVRRLGMVMAAVLVVGAVAACGEDDGLERADLIGTFDDIEFVVTSDVITDVLDIGGDIDMTLEADGTTTGRMFVPAGVPRITEGTGALDTSLEGTWTFMPGRDRVAFDFEADNFLEDLSPFKTRSVFGGGVWIQITTPFQGVVVDMTFSKG